MKRNKSHDSTFQFVVSCVFVCVFQSCKKISAHPAGRKGLKYYLHPISTTVRSLQG